MKKTIIALLCLILTTGAAMAQKTFTFGPKIGVDYTHFWGKDCLHGGQINYQAGMFMEYRFSDKFSLAVVINPENMPPYGTAPYGSEFNYADYTYNQNYINVPVMLKYYVTPALSIDFGPQLGINVYHKCTIKGKGDNKDFKETVSTKTKNMDFGLGLGLTYNITENVFVQGRYTMGMTNISNAKEGDGFGTPAKPKNGNAQISIGFRF